MCLVRPREWLPSALTLHRQQAADMSLFPGPTCSLYPRTGRGKGRLAFAQSLSLSLPLAVTRPSPLPLPSPYIVCLPACGFPSHTHLEEHSEEHQCAGGCSCLRRRRRRTPPSGLQWTLAQAVDDGGGSGPAGRVLQVGRTSPGGMFYHLIHLNF